MRARIRRLKDCWVVISDAPVVSAGDVTHALVAQPEQGNAPPSSRPLEATFAPRRRRREHRNRGWAWNLRQTREYLVQRRLKRLLSRSHSAEKNSEPPLSGSAGGGVGGGTLGAGVAAAATSSGAASPAATSAPDGTSASVGAPGSASRVERHVAKSRSRRFETSCIMPPRPNWARRPVMLKSVTASTRVAPSCSLSVLTIVALAPPWPRLSVPRALSVARWAVSSTSSILIVPL